MKKFFLFVLMSVMLVCVACGNEKSAEQSAPAEPKVEQRPVETERVLNLGITIEEFKLAFNKIVAERNVSQLALNNLQSFDSGEKFVQQYPAGLYLFGVVDRETGFLKEVTIGKEFLLSESKRQYEVDAAGVAFLVAVAALNPELSPNERGEILNKLSKNAKNSSVVLGNAKYSSLLFDKGKSLALSIKAKDSK